jgi:hypothetical protein
MFGQVNEITFSSIKSLWKGHNVFIKADRLNDFENDDTDTDDTDTDTTWS